MPRSNYWCTLLTPPPVRPSAKIGSFVGIELAMRPQLARAFGGEWRAAPALRIYRCTGGPVPMKSENWFWFAS